MIHRTALVDEQAKLAADVEVGPYSIIGPRVTIGSGSRIGPHVVVTGNTEIGKENRIFQFSSIGEEPQDKKYAGEDTRLVIGDRNTIREGCTISTGTTQGDGVTTVGSDNWIMANVHIAHDCHIGSNVIMANNSTLGGHVSIGDWAILSGFSLIHQRCDVGTHSFIGFASHVNQSIPPYVTVAGEKARPRGINAEGLRRRGFTPEQGQQVRRAYRLLYRDKLSLAAALVQLKVMAADSSEIKPLVEFLESSERSIIR